MTRSYEVLVLLRATGTEAELAQSAKQLEAPIQKLGGHIDHSASWGRRRLAYRISHQTEGAYQLVTFQMPPANLDELKRQLRLNEAILRFLVLSREDHHAPETSAGVPHGESQSRAADR